MLLGVGLLFVVRLYTSSQALLFRTVNPSLEILVSGTLVLAIGLMLRSLFRAGHFDLDVYPSQAVLQGSFTVLLAGIYLLIVGAFAKVVAYLGGDAAFAFKAFGVLVSVVLLAVLLQSDRARLRLRQFVNRNFQRPLYDYRTIWARFTEATASRVDLADLCRSLVKLVADLCQALSVTIWLVDENRGTLSLAASTSLSDAQAAELRPQGADAAGIIRYLKQHPVPTDIELVKEDWAAALRRAHPDEFHKGGTRVCVPIMGAGGLLAFITVGDRVSGSAFALQDLDLLKCVGDQAAASLLNMRLSQTLLQARELEAFQTMAAFFVHDLKNAASTLNLMLQNLPVHFDDPAFREDALRGIAKTVAHINDLISRLSLIRHELRIQPASASLNDVVTGAMGSLQLPAGVVVTQDLQVLPALGLDREQIVKVVTNLVLNAADAVDSAGQVRVATAQIKGWAVLTVVDNGCGMSAEFVARSLFRPFQTTKKSGLGIGMFQSKMIVEAHGGRIEVASEPGKGTTMQVFLPLAPTDAGSKAKAEGTRE
jgi:putative PEP-CTERM system histidine kinase